MLINTNGISVFSSFEEIVGIVMLRLEYQKSAPARVDVVPHAVFLGECWNSCVVVETAHNSCTSAWINEEWMISFLDLSFDHFFECVNVHCSRGSMTRNLKKLVHAHSRHHCSTFYRIVRLLSGEADWSIFRFPAFQSNMWKMFLSRRKHGHYNRHTTSRIERTINGFRIKSKSFSKELYTLLFHDREHRRNMIDMCIGV